MTETKRKKVNIIELWDESEPTGKAQRLIVEILRKDVAQIVFRYLGFQHVCFDCKCVFFCTSVRPSEPDGKLFHPCTCYFDRADPSYYCKKCQDRKFYWKLFRVGVQGALGRPIDLGSIVPDMVEKITTLFDQ